MPVMREEKHLRPARQTSEHPKRRGCSGVICVNKNVIQDDWARRHSFNVMLNRGKPQRKIQLIACRR